MPRILGVDIPMNKRVTYALQTIYGIGPKTATDIIAATGVNPDTRVKDLTEDDVSKLLAFGFSNYDSQKVVDKNNFVRKVGVKNSKVKDVLVYPKEDIYILKPKDEGGSVETKVKMYKNVIVAPHSRGDSVGKVEAFYNGQSVGTAEVETRVDIKEITYLEVVEELID